MESPNANRESIFYAIEHKFLSCPIDGRCRALCNKKMPVGSHGDYHCPTSDYLGDDYSGIVIVGGNPAMPKNPWKDADVCRAILAFLAAPSLEKGREVNKAAERLIPEYGIVKNRVFHYSGWGLTLKQFAYLNSYKCRTYENYNAFGKPDLLSVCFKNYLKAQMDLLKPKLVIYLWKSVYDSVLALGVAPGFGGDSCYFNGRRDLPKEPQHEMIRKKVERILPANSEQIANQELINRIVSDVLKKLNISVPQGSGHDPKP